MIHLAGENRPTVEADFAKVNTNLTAELCKIIKQEITAKNRYVPLVFASSTQAQQNNPYGKSKLAAEEKVRALAQVTDNPCVVFRLPGVFGQVVQAQL